MNYCNKIHNHFINCISMLLIILVLSSNRNMVSIVRAADAQWKTESFTLPVVLRGAAVHYQNGKMYVIGGESKHLSVLNTVYIYDFETNEWTTGAPMTNKRFLFASNLVDGKIYVMGGYNNTTTEWYAVNNVDIYDIETNTWTESAPMPTPAAYIKSIIYGDELYIFGGYYAGTGNIRYELNCLQIYNTKSNTWRQTTMPFTIHGYNVEVIEDKAYLIGGISNKVYLSSLNIFDITDNTWTTGKPLIESKYLGATSIHNNKIYVMSGANENGLSKAFYVYDPVTNTWSKKEDLISPKIEYTSLIIDNKIYLLGGRVDLATYTFTNAVESLQLPEAYNRLYAHLYINEKTQLIITNNIADNKELIWKSSTPRVATVDSSGMVTAMETGTTFISAYNSNGTLVDYIPVIVTKNDAYRMALHLNVGQNQKLYASGNKKKVTWMSMDSSTATVDKNGLVTGTGKGLAIVSADIAGEQHYIYLRVN